MRSSVKVRSRPFGMTLLEMVVVLAIMAGLASLVVPALGYLKSQADDAAGATACADVMTNLETYYTSIGHYPVRMDSLLTSGGELLPALWEHVPVEGMPAVAGLPAYLTAGTVPSDTGTSYSQSIGHAFGSGATVLPHSTTATDPSSSGDVSTAYSLAKGAKVAVVNSTSSIAKAIFPGTVPTDVTLVAVGVGPNCSAVGKTMAAAPRFAGMESDEYARYVAIFALYADGTPAKLKAVLNPQGLTGDSMVASYKAAVAASDK